MAQGRTVGRYVMFDEIGAGGMATVHLGRLVGSSGFSRIVAIKRLHPYCARDPKFTASFLDEARLTARIQHPNVAAMLDVVSTNEELLLVMEYIHGESLSRLLSLVLAKEERVAPNIVVAVMLDVLRGLHAAHQAKSELGEPLGIIHRDVTPQNIIVGADGVSRLLDFGVAKAAARLQTTAEGHIKGKFAYMPPEQLQDDVIDRRVDVYAASVVLWEALTVKRLFGGGDNPANVVTRVLEMPVDPPSSIAPDVPRALDEVVMRGLEREKEKRFATAEELAHALEHALAPATVREVAAWVRATDAEKLAQREQLVSSVERAPIPATGEPAAAVSAAPAIVIDEASNITVAVGKPVARSSRRSLVVAFATVVLVASGVTAFASGWLRRPPTTTSSTTTVPRPSDTPTPPSTTTAIASTPAASVEPLPSAKPPRVVSTHVPPRATASTTSTKPSCDPPYTLDPNDPRVHIPKPECL